MDYRRRRRRCEWDINARGQLYVLRRDPQLNSDSEYDSDGKQQRDYDSQPHCDSDADGHFCCDCNLDVECNFNTVVVSLGGHDPLGHCSAVLGPGSTSCGAQWPR